MIDIHTHLLPGVDDGAATAEASASVLGRFARDGVHTVVCTPHLRATDVGTIPHADYDAAFAGLQQCAPASPRLLRGWEIMLDAPGQDLTGPELALGGSRAVLVEFPHGAVPPGATAELRRLRSTGVVPVLAHPERYLGCSMRLVREWREAGVVVQTDATMLLGAGPMTRLARELLEHGLIDCLASDNHGDGRTLATSRRWLEELGAGEQAQLLTATNAELLLHDRPVVRVPEVRLPRGTFDRLRQMVFGRA